MFIGEDGGGDGGAVVAPQTHQHQTQLGHLNTNTLSVSHVILHLYQHTPGETDTNHFCHFGCL